MHTVDGYDLANVPTDGHDIGGLVTTEALPVAPLTLSRTPIDSSIVGKVARVVGFGEATAADPSSAGTRKEVLLPITTVDDNFIVEKGEAGATCSGDSGGPTFLTDGDTSIVVGIHSSNVGSNGKCVGRGNSDTRVDLFAASFVDPLIAMAEGTASDAGAEASTPDDASATVPSDGTSSSAGGCDVAHGRRSTSMNDLSIAATLAATAGMSVALRRRRRSRRHVARA